MLRLRALVTIALLAGALALAACGEKEENLEPPPSEGFAIAGNWSGALTQKGLPGFQIAVRIREPASGIPTRVAYTGINCGGEWRFLGMEGGVYRFREDINEGAGGTCKGTGDVTLTPDPGGAASIAYVFTGGGVQSQGTLGPATAETLKATFAQAGVTLGGQ